MQWGRTQERQEVFETLTSGPDICTVPNCTKTVRGNCDAPGFATGALILQEKQSSCLCALADVSRKKDLRVDEQEL
jgi:hypothetical protein